MNISTLSPPSACSTAPTSLADLGRLHRRLAPPLPALPLGLPIRLPKHLDIVPTLGTLLPMVPCHLDLVLMHLEHLARDPGIRRDHPHGADQRRHGRGDHLVKDVLWELADVGVCLCQSPSINTHPKNVVAGEGFKGRWLGV